MTEKSQPSWARLAAFAGPSVPLAALGLPLVVFLPEYYSNDLGLPLQVVGSAFGLVRLLDIGVDPLLGALMDRTRTPFGRFRPWVVAGAPVLIAAVYMLFMASRGVGPVYLWFWLLIAYLGVSMSLLAHVSWASTLSTSYDGRSRTYAWVQSYNVVGLIAVLLLPALLSQVLHVGSAGGVHAMGWMTIVLIPLTFVAALSLVGEPNAPAQVQRVRISDYLAVFKNPTILRLLAVDQIVGLAPNITGTLVFFYLEQIKHFPKGQAEVLLVGYFLAALAGGPIWLWLAHRAGKHRALAVAAIFYTVTQSSAMFAPVGNALLMGAAMVLAGLPFSAGGLLIRSMLADAADEERLATGADRTGLLYSLSSANGKIGSAAAVLVSFWVLHAIGFQPGSAHNSPQALIGLQLLFAVIPGLLGLAGAMLIYGYPLTAARHAEVRAQLAERERAAAIPLPSEEGDREAVDGASPIHRPIVVR
jgi:Na+/melibiose symporter-like transporter